MECHHYAVIHLHVLSNPSFLVLTVAFRPDGQEVAVSTLTGEITFWNPHTAAQNCSIEGRRDLGYSRKEQEKITAKKSSFGKYV